MTVDSGRRALYLGFVGTREVLTAVPRDFARILGRSAKPRLRMEPGVNRDADATQIALYVHYSATGQISEMVRCQVKLLAQFGFSIVFISMSDVIPRDDWQAIRQLAALVVQRPNFGLDWGAWRDLIPEVQRRWSTPTELLLVNDSVLGPIHPLAPAIDSMRAGGPGLFGLTESLQGGAHLQSYMLLIRGKAAVEDVMLFLRTLRISSSKWIMVRMSEVRLSRWMRRRGHRVAAVFGYERLVRATIADPDERRKLIALYWKPQNLAPISTEAVIAALHFWPQNPTHHLWRVLVTKFHFPFVKTELIRRNPTAVSGVLNWPDLVPPESPCTLPVIKAHLATLTATDADKSVTTPDVPPDTSPDRTA